MSVESRSESGGGLVAHGLSATYSRGRSQTQALEDCSFIIDEGARATIIGPSGCGKSTALRIFADVIRASDGVATIGGVSPREARQARSFSLVAQESAMLEWRTLLGNVALGLEIAGVARRERQRRAMEMIELVGLRGFESAYPHELSGGMRQRATIARSLALKPRYLLMDEPFGALDELTRQHLNFELLRILDETRATLLLVTHSITEAVILSDDVFVMSPRPGHITDHVRVELGERRTPEVRDDPHFLRLEQHLRHCLERPTSVARRNPGGAK